MHTRVIEPATVEPISLEEAKRHLRADSYYDSPGFDSPEADIDDEDILGMITEAREWCEGWTCQSFAVQTLETSLDQFPGVVDTTESKIIELPGSPVQEIVSLTYTDSAGDEQTMDVAGFQLDTSRVPNRLAPLPNASWPGVQGGRLGAVRIRYVAGYSLPGDSPEDNTLPRQVVRAIKLVLGHFFENHEETSIVKLESIPLGAKSLLRRYRVEKGMA